MSEGGNRWGLQNFKPRRQREGRNEHQINVPPLRHTTEFRGRLLGKEKDRRLPKIYRTLSRRVEVSRRLQV